MEVVHGELSEIRLLAATDPQAARERLGGIEIAGGKEYLLELAHVSEELGDLARAVTACNRILDADENDGDAILALAEIRRDQGDTERAVRCLERLEALGDPRARLLLEEIGAENERGSANKEEPAEDFRPAAAGDAEIVAFRDAFAGREGVYARQWRAPDGRSGYSPVREPLTPALVRQHLLGAVTLGVYPVTRDNQCRFFAFDVDCEVDPETTTRRRLEEALGRTLAAASRMRTALASLGLDALLESSGFKGHHVWVLFDEPWPAWKARRLARGILKRTEPLPQGVAVEIFPAQDRVRDGGLGNLIKLPLGVHRRSGRQSLLLDGPGEVSRDPHALIAQVRRAPPEVLELALEEVATAPDGQDGSAGGQDGSDAPSSPATAPLSGSGADSLSRAEAVPLEPPYDIEGDEELAFVLAGCPTLRALVQRAREPRALTHDEQAVVTYTLGHLANGPRAVNLLLSSSPGAQLLVSRLRGSPMSCAKIRGRLSLEPRTESCSCEFEPTLGSYPHPLLHTAALAAEREAREAAPPAAAAEAAALESELARIGKEIARLEALASSINARLAAARPSEQAAGPGLAKVIPLEPGTAARKGGA